MVQQRISKKIIVIIAVMLMIPTNVNAYEINDIKINTNVVTIHSFTKNNTTTTDEYTSCSGADNSILGDVNDENSVAWLVQKILNYIKVLGPILAIVLSAIDYTKAIVASDNDTMKKTHSKFIKRMIAAVLLFFVPMFTSVILQLFGITSDNATCGLK